MTFEGGLGFEFHLVPSTSIYCQYQCTGITAVLAEGASRGSSVLTIYVRPIVTPHYIAETHQVARRRKRNAKQKIEGRGGDMEGCTMDEAASTTEGLSSVDPSCTIHKLCPFFFSFFFFLSQSSTQLALKRCPKSTFCLALLKQNRVKTCLQLGASSWPASPPGGGSRGSWLRLAATRALFSCSVMASDATSAYCTGGASKPQP